MPESINAPTIERLPQVMRRTGLPKSEIYRQMVSGKFPKSVALTDGRTRGWGSQAVTEWIEAKLKSADPQK